MSANDDERSTATITNNVQNRLTELHRRSISTRSLSALKSVIRLQTFSHINIMLATGVPALCCGLAYGYEVKVGIWGSRLTDEGYPMPCSREDMVSNALQCGRQSEGYHYPNHYINPVCLLTYVGTSAFYAGEEKERKRGGRGGRKYSIGLVEASRMVGFAAGSMRMAGQA
jgi:hypothetical protein